MFICIKWMGVQLFLAAFSRAVNGSSINGDEINGNGKKKLPEVGVSVFPRLMFNHILIRGKLCVRLMENGSMPCDTKTKVHLRDECRQSHQSSFLIAIRISYSDSGLFAFQVQQLPTFDADDVFQSNGGWKGGATQMIVEFPSFRSFLKKKYTLVAQEQKD